MYKAYNVTSPTLFTIIVEHIIIGISSDKSKKKELPNTF